MGKVTRSDVQKDAEVEAVVHDGPNGTKYGVAIYDGSFYSRPYGWASKGNDYREGPVRWFQFVALLDAKRLARKLAR